MPIDPYFLDEERRSPPTEVRKSERPRWLVPGVVLAAAGLFLAGWYSVNAAFVFLLVAAGAILLLTAWVAGERIRQDGVSSMFYRRSIFTDIALGEHDQSVVPSLVLFATIVIAIFAAVLLTGRHPRLLDFARTSTSQRATP